MPMPQPRKQDAYDATPIREAVEANRILQKSVKRALAQISQRMAQNRRQAVRVAQTIAHCSNGIDNDPVAYPPNPYQRWNRAFFSTNDNHKDDDGANAPVDNADTVLRRNLRDQNAAYGNQSLSLAPPKSPTSSPSLTTMTPEEERFLYKYIAILGPQFHLDGRVRIFPDGRKRRKPPPRRTEGSSAMWTPAEEQRLCLALKAYHDSDQPLYKASTLLQRHLKSVTDKWQRHLRPRESRHEAGANAT